MFPCFGLMVIFVVSKALSQPLEAPPQTDIQLGLSKTPQSTLNPTLTILRPKSERTRCPLNLSHWTSRPDLVQVFRGLDP